MMRIIGVLGAFLVSGSAFSATSHYDWLPHLFNAPKFELNFDDIRATAQGRTTALDALKAIVAQKPELKTTFTLVYRSQSLQAASKKDPRILFFAPNGLFFSFATHAESENIEIMQFNPITSAFDFREITFKRGVAEVNNDPKSCFACHAGRPIWESYATWPGVYGSTDDYYFKERMTEASKVERAELKVALEQNQNEFLKAIDLGKEDYFVDGPPPPDVLFTPVRRNSYLLFHLGYYHLLTYDSRGSGDFSYPLSFIDPPEYYSYGGDFPLAFAARTKTLGFEPNEIYASAGNDGNSASDLEIPILKKPAYQATYKNSESLTTVYRAPVIAKCLSCHAEGNSVGAPPIPFNRASEFQARVKQTDLGEKIRERIDPRNVGTRLQMPPGEKLSDADRESLIDFVETSTERSLLGH